MTAQSLALAAAAAVLVFWMLGAYNRLVSLRNAIGAAWQQVAAALAQRGSAIGPLASALRAPLPGESATLEALLLAQAQVDTAAEAMASRPVLAALAAALVKAEATMASSASRVLALIDGHPALRDDPQVSTHERALRDAMPTLDFARQRFNEAVGVYNAAARQFPTRLLVRLFGFGTAGRI